MSVFDRGRSAGSLPPLRPGASAAAPGWPIDVRAATPHAELTARARAASSAGDPRQAAVAWAEVVASGKASAAQWDEYGLVLVATGDADGAVAAFRQAIALDPGAGEPQLHLGQLLKRDGDAPAAVAAFAAALHCDPRLDAARAALAELGRRDAIPLASLDREAVWRMLQAAADDGRAERMDRERAAAWPLIAYDRFRREIAIRPPPGPMPDIAAGTLSVVVDARGALAAMLRATLASLIDQSLGAWRAHVVAEPALRDHSVGGFAAVDARIGFVDEAVLPEAGYIVLLDAGTVLDREALHWLVWAARRTGSAALLCDEDRAIEHWRHGLHYSEPSLRGVFDAGLVAAAALPPAVLLVDAARARPGAIDAEACRALLLAQAGQVAHLPRLLASRLDIGLIAQNAPFEEGAGEVPRPFARAAAPMAAGEERILVVIPIRDEAALLDTALRTLREQAARPDRLDIVVVDNRSSAPETRALLGAETRAGRITVLPFDEPFNWARANNLAAARGDQPDLLFVNNDVEMLTQGWDDRLIAALARPEVGVVGARLLYPDRTVQHAGITLGVVDGPPMHAGRGAAAGDPGPDGRWITPHTVAAVTGAFLAVRRTTFEQAGGFDAARFFVTYNDVDLCLKVRAAGLLVHYAADIELIHLESRTRGLNVARDKVAWDQGELADLYARWGEVMLSDPGYSPGWGLGGEPFDGIREPRLDEIVRHLDRSAGARPWAPERPETSATDR